MLTLDTQPQEQTAPNGFESDKFLVAHLERLADALVLTLGESLCEVVIHDFRQPDHSIVWIRGQVTRRTVGGSMSQIGLAMLAAGDEAEDRVNYITRTRDGKVLKSFTVALRDANGHVFGAICFNLDITGLTTLEHALRNFIGNHETQSVSNIQFSNRVTDVAQVMIDEVTQQFGLAGPALDTQQRLELVRVLDQRGFFGVRHSINLLATYLGVSRASIYNYLKEAHRLVDTDSQDGR